MLHIGNIPIHRGSKVVYGVITLPWEILGGSIFLYYIHTMLVDGQLFYILYIPHDFNHWAIHVPTGYIVDIRILLTDSEPDMPSPPT